MSSNKPTSPSIACVAVAIFVYIHSTLYVKQTKEQVKWFVKRKQEHVCGRLY